jgi:putative glutamine amidotransferase
MRHELATERFYLARYYSEAVEAAGGVPVHISLIPSVSYISSLAERLDGILLPGSASDVDPLRYGREPQPGLGEVHPTRDETDELILTEVENRGLPLLAICYGLQIWNVVRGGTLIQDIKTHLPEAIQHEQGAPRDRRSHRVRLLKGSRLAQFAKSDNALVNSHHHQGIETVGRDLRPAAWTADKLIEALEETRDDRWALGVQWHPEIGWAEDPFAKTMFEAFIESAKRYMSRSHEKAHVSLEQNHPVNQYSVR